MVTYEPWGCGGVPREQSLSVDGQLGARAARVFVVALRTFV
jgi:hypothetical protein